MSVLLDAENAGRLPAFDCKTQNNIFDPDSENQLNAEIIIAKESFQNTQKSSTKDNYTKMWKRTTIGRECDLITESLKTIRSRCASVGPILAVSASLQEALLYFTYFMKCPRLKVILILNPPSPYFRFS